ncbi:tetratricopeptide repeat protein [Anatilimnocola floriformis]|uniref:tetratricopeptide repeat protein n=1 Tax=Anatilimnocola floriformis TaxID=2948575 RepID=UPI0020C43BA7|nr:tetratricopeptide repeat protein [Anatilimnocola floriformis]
MAEPPFDLAKAHRWFAVELNNQAWDLLEKADRTPDETERLIHAAHAACFHWLHAGNLLNHLRAQNLLATAYARSGLGESAVRHAEKCLALSNEAGDTQTPFDLATAHGCAAAAYRAAGQPTQATAAQQQAIAAANKLTDPGDRQVFDSLYAG